MRETIEAVVAELVRPLIQADGGTIEVLAVEDRRVVLQLSGACSGCPGLTYTHHHLITPLLRAKIAADLEVEVRRGPASALSHPPAAPAASGH